MNPDAIAVAVRALALICLYQAAGAVFFVALFHQLTPSVSRRVCRLGVIAALCGILLVLPLPPLEAARMAGDMDGVSNSGLLRLALHSTRADVYKVQLVGLLLIVVGLWSHRANSAAVWTLWVAVIGALLAAAALTLTGHTSVNPQRALLAPLLGLHLISIAFWFGGLWPLLLTLRHESAAATAAVMRRFSRFAIWLVPCIALAGFGMACVLIDSWDTFEQPYGCILIAKAVVFGALMALGALNRSRYTPALEAAARSTVTAASPASPAEASGALRRTILAEYLLIIGVFAMTATLTSLYSPEH